MQVWAHQPGLALALHMRRRADAAVIHTKRTAHISEQGRTIHPIDRDLHAIEVSQNQIRDLD